MTDTINQMRLSMRLDAYLRAYIGKNVKGDNLSRDEWDTVWQVADSARTNKNLIIARIDHLISARWMRPLSQRWWSHLWSRLGRRPCRVRELRMSMSRWHDGLYDRFYHLDLFSKMIPLYNLRGVLNGHRCFGAHIRSCFTGRINQRSCLLRDDYSSYLMSFSLSYSRRISCS
jgi:hypothetical protein